MRQGKKIMNVDTSICKHDDGPNDDTLDKLVEEKIDDSLLQRIFCKDQTIPSKIVAMLIRTNEGGTLGSLITCNTSSCIINMVAFEEAKEVVFVEVLGLATIDLALGIDFGCYILLLYYWLIGRKETNFVYGIK